MIYGSSESSDFLDEDEYLDQITNDIKSQSMTIKKTIQVITYVVDLTINKNYPIIQTICNFNGDILPEIDSIIWAPDITHQFLVPYKVLRIDFLEDEENQIQTEHKTLIVVKKVSGNDIL